MNTFDIVTVIAIILFARLGVRLVGQYLSINEVDETEAQNDRT